MSDDSTPVIDQKKFLDTISKLPPGDKVAGILGLLSFMAIPFLPDGLFKVAPLGFVIILVLIVRVTGRSSGVADLEESQQVGAVTTRKIAKGSVFISSPMASILSGDAKTQHNAEITSLKSELTKKGYTEPYYAGQDRSTEGDYSFPYKARQVNFAKIEQSELFVLVLPDELPTSCLVEVGAALAHKVPSIWFVKTGVKTPFLMRNPSASNDADNMPKIIEHQYSSIDDIVAIISKNGLSI